MSLIPSRIIEAVLFSAGKPLLVEEIAQASRLDPAAVKEALKELQAEYAARDTALEVGRAGPKWSMQIRTEFADRAKHLAAMEIPVKVLRTLALIAFHQPIKQFELKAMIGSVVYDHVAELHERGMVAARQDGITKTLTTTERFLEYFGIDATDQEGIRHFLAKKVGITLGANPTSAQPEKSSDASDQTPPSDVEPEGKSAAALATVNSQPL
jgi:segregation and condensation protein B